MIIGTVKIEKCIHEDSKLNYVSFIDLEYPEYEYREYCNGCREWLKNNQQHREDGPAVIEADTPHIIGQKVWCIEGKIHREGAPAIEYYDGSSEWYFNDLLHRLDGPAIDNGDGTGFWYIDGVFVGKKDPIKE